MTPIRRLLVANRGEIAVRVIRAAREMGIHTIAVFSEADTHAIHVQLADEAHCIGPGEAALSYLDANKIIDVALQSRADAIHPGYGFLSERAEFSESCKSAGIIFVGPSAGAMQLLGSKMEAKSLAVKAGVPVVPGYFERGADEERLRSAAHLIGYPVLLKASAGGGGRGMRIVRSDQDFANEHSIATSEALKAFGDGSMMVEKLIERPRHIEVQVLADDMGNVTCLFERECSIQRRHQKLIEESPSPLKGYEELWPGMRAAAIALVKEAHYVGAGTVEFIVDPQDGAFYFLEVNARLQVEHPVTEAITGLDLVQWQLKIAQGEPLSIDHALIEGNRERQVGHAIEARVVAEDPDRNFMPSVGKILAWGQPSGPGIRVDTGYQTGIEVPSFYDSLLAKVIVHAETRASAIRKLTAALEDFHVLGVKTNIEFLLSVLASKEFQVGEIDTGLVDRDFHQLPRSAFPGELALILNSPLLSSESRSKTVSEPSGVTVWMLTDGYRNAR